MENLLLEAGGVMGLTYYLLNLIKPIIPEKAKPYIPLLSALLAGLLNMAIKQENFLENFFSGVLMGLSTSKGHDIQRDLSTPPAKQKPAKKDTKTEEIAKLVESMSAALKK